jgi:molybdopterin synthase sulfur carrier subunit
MKVNLLAFAQVRDQLGWSEHTVECDPEDTPRTVFARVAPELHVEAMRVAVDQEYFPWDEPIGARASEIALIPPVSGG